MTELLRTGEETAAPWRPKSAETVARRIVQTIVDGELGVGDKLPREADMVEQYGAGRETVREALRLLETQGLITLRRGPGGGPVVAAAEALNLGRISSLYYQMSGATYQELAEAWVVGEGLLAERAARNPDARLRARLMAPYRAGSPDPTDLDSGTITRFIVMHTAFHDTVGILGGNRVLALSLASFGQIVSYQAGFINDPRELRELIHHDHIDLARAIAAGHHVVARDLMCRHIEGVWSYCRSRVVPDPNEPVRWA